MKTTIAIPPPSPHRDRRNWAAPFEQFLGYQLAPQARRVITILERQRARGKPQRLLVVDDHPESGRLQQALCDYIIFCKVRVQSHTAFHIVGRTRKEAMTYLRRRRLNRLPDPDYQAIIGTARSPEYARGLDFSSALILDADSYPRRGKGLSRVWRTVLPVIGGSKDSLLVVHGRFRHRTRVNFFTNEVRRSRGGGTPIPALDIGLPEDEERESGLDYDLIATLSRAAVINLRRDISPSARAPLSSRLIKLIELHEQLNEPLA